LQKHSHNYTLVIIPVASPLLIGLYRENQLIKSVSSEQKTSDILLPILTELMNTYPVSRMIYTKGPGSQMAIKLTYIMLQTIEIVQNIPCFGCSAFSFNGGKPIKAIGNLYFIKEKETIITKKFEHAIEEATFYLPQSIHTLKIDKISMPEYNLPAV